MPEPFKALRVHEQSDGSFTKSIEEVPMDTLPDHDVLIRVYFAGLNYKDALSASGHKGVTRRFPHTPGVDAAGVVQESRDPRFVAGMEVIVTSYDLGMNTPGGFSEYVRVPGDWIIPKPEGLGLGESMVIGTGGLTAGMALFLMEQAELTPDKGPIVVTGATGGVGSMAVAILSKAGYQAWACTGSSDKEAYLKSLGAAEILPREQLATPTKKPIFKGGWAGGIDTVGGELLSNLVKGCGMYGSVAVCGLVGSPEFSLTVYPFILKGIHLIGVESAEYPMEARRKVWQQLSHEWRLSSGLLAQMAHYCSLEDIPSYMDAMLQGRTQGRIVAAL
jgi:putative YhdH/YhfP family quinone oxidoreductase